MDTTHSDGPKFGDLVIADDDMQNVVIIRPGQRDPDDTNHARTEPERINADTLLAPLDIVLFYDKQAKTPVDQGVNQQAFVVDDKRALYQRCLIRSISLAALRSKSEAIVVRGVPYQVAPYVAKMLLRYRWRPNMFNFATNFIRAHNYGPFIRGNLFPDDVSYQYDDEYEVAWSRFVQNLEPHDYLLTFDRASLLSRIIAIGTLGPFSHIASYMGDGNIWEVVTTGTRIVPLETYKSRRYRVAAYRNYGHSFVTKEEAMAHYEKTAGMPGYNYVGAFKAGVRTFLGDRTRSPTTPNGIILGGLLAFIDQV